MLPLLKNYEKSEFLLFFQTKLPCQFHGCWQRTQDSRSETKDSLLLTAIATVKVPAIVLVLLPNSQSAMQRWLDDTYICRVHIGEGP